MQHWPIRMTLTSTWPWPEVKFWSWPFKVIIHMFRSVLTRETRWWYYFVCSTISLKVICKKLCFILKPPFWILSPLWRQFLPWSKNDLYKSCTACEALSNVFYRFSLACVVIEILNSVCLCVDVFNLPSHKMALREFLNMSDWSETSQKVFSHGFTPYPTLRLPKYSFLFFTIYIGVTLIYTK